MHVSQLSYSLSDASSSVSSFTYSHILFYVCYHWVLPSNSIDHFQITQVIMEQIYHCFIYLQGVGLYTEIVGWAVSMYWYQSVYLQINCGLYTGAWYNGGGNISACIGCILWFEPVYTNVTRRHLVRQKCWSKVAQTLGKQNRTFSFTYMIYYV